MVIRRRSTRANDVRIALRGSILERMIELSIQTELEFWREKINSEKHQQIHELQLGEFFQIELDKNDSGLRTNITRPNGPSRATQVKLQVASYWR